ncbi:MAG: end-binding protein Ku [Nocardioidaceae bacterium]|nr:end-binding protein Ku [Nocardioidaceae bacterium]
MHAIWKGTISFGLVTIPVKVYSATEERDISFRQVHEADGGRIRYKRVCEVDGEEVPYSDIGKGYEMPDGRMVVLTSDDFSSLPLPTTRAIEVLEFVPTEQVDPLYFAKAYYLAADGVGAKPYVLLRDALTGSGQCALVKVAIRTRETLALLRERDGALVLQTMLWPDEVRDSDFAVPDDSVEIRSQEVKMAESYIATLQNDFDPARYHSDYREALEQLVEAKASGLPMPEAEEDDGQQAEVLDLVAALRASVDAAKKRRAGSNGSDDEQADSEAGSRQTGTVGSQGTSGSNGSSGAKKATKSASKTAPAKKAAKASGKTSEKKRPAKKSA